MNELPAAMDKLEQSVADLRLTMGGSGHRLSWHDLQRLDNFTDFLFVIQANLQLVVAWLEQNAERGRGLDHCYKRGLVLLQHLQSFCRCLVRQKVFLVGRAIPEFESSFP